MRYVVLSRGARNRLIHVSQRSKVTAHGAERNDARPNRGGAAGDTQLRFPIQVPVRIEIGRIRREVEQRDRLGARGHTGPDVWQLVDVQMVEDIND